ncbi:adhesin [Escherichia coli]|uniref:AfaD family invasin n=1 Tax=Escherichia coli TaxID=562 RepID=UPI000E1FC0A1|nr:AfaD family invasin [Escherichia coli]EHY5882437.1 adhesin [Escherichia coli]
MKKTIRDFVFSGAVLMTIGGLSQAAEVNLVPQRGVTSNLPDGSRIATGRIVCREAHTGFHVWINAHPVGNRVGSYIIQGKQGRGHELRVRIDGDRWSPSVTKREGMVRHTQNEQAVFDVVADGKQHVVPDEYIYTVTGECL